MAIAETVSDLASRIVRVAVVQATPVPHDSAATIARVADLTADAAQRGARLVVFPEAFVGGYPKGQDFGVVIGRRSAEGRDEFRRYCEGAIAVPSAATEALGAAARANGVHLVVGVVERDGGTLFCSALTFGPDGTLLAKRRKVMPTALERVIWGSGDGSTLAVVATDLGRIGVAICWENYMPLLRMALYAQGVEIYCAPTVDDRETWLATVRHIALEGRCFVVSACQFLPADDPTEGAQPLIRGGSCIIGPLGEVLAEPIFGQEAILTADLDRAEITRARFDFDPVGHYARPDLFRLIVDDRPRRAVEFRSDDPDAPDSPRG